MKIKVKSKNRGVIPCSS